MTPYDQHTHHLFAPIGEALVNIPVAAIAHPDAFTFVPGRHYSAGLFPFDDIVQPQPLLRNLETLLEGRRIQAVGECGLDRGASLPMLQQTAWFEAQMSLADAYGVPLIVHCVKAWAELIEIARRHPAAVAPRIVHGFRGKPQLAEMLLAEGFHLSFGPLFNAQSVRLCPAERLHIETDAADVAIQSVSDAVVSARAAQIKT